MVKRLIIILSVLALLFTAGITYLVLQLSDNMAVKTSKITVNGEMKLTIGKLIGYYDVETILIQEDGKSVAIPFRATVEEGNVILFVEREGEIVWQNEVEANDSKEGVIQFTGITGNYDLKLYTEEAKEIKMEFIFW